MKTEGAIKNGHYRDTGNIRENRRSNQEWTIQIHRQHWDQDIERSQTKQKTKKVSNIDPI